MASGLLPKSPVSSSLCDEVPHIFIQKSHLEPIEFLISSAKRLLQHNRHLADNPVAPALVRFWHLADKPTVPGFVAYWTNNGQRAALGLNRYAANETQRWGNRPAACE